MSRRRGQTVERGAGRKKQQIRRIEAGLEKPIVLLKEEKPDASRVDFATAWTHLTGKVPERLGRLDTTKLL